MSRDPRIDPKPGDVLQGGRHTFYVTDVVSGQVIYTEDAPPPPTLSLPLSEWQEYAKSDTVLVTAEVPT